MHEGVWLKKKIDKMTAIRTETIITLYDFCICMDSAFMGRSTLYDFCICMDSAFMGRSTPTTDFDGAI